MPESKDPYAILGRRRASVLLVPAESKSPSREHTPPNLWQRRLFTAGLFSILDILQLCGYMNSCSQRQRQIGRFMHSSQIRFWSSRLYVVSNLLDKLASKLRKPPAHLE